MTTSNRRTFLKQTAAASGVLMAGSAIAHNDTGTGKIFELHPSKKLTQAGDERTVPPDMPPAGWIWYPSTRTLANTMVLFRRMITLPAAPRRATPVPRHAAVRRPTRIRRFGLAVAAAELDGL